MALMEGGKMILGEERIFEYDNPQKDIHIRLKDDLMRELVRFVRDSEKNGVVIPDWLSKTVDYYLHCREEKAEDGVDRE